MTLAGPRRLRTGALVLTAFFASPLLADETCGEKPNAAENDIRYAMYFMSRVQDAPECTMKVVDGKIVAADPVTNPAMTCPDMFAWKLFAEVVNQEFWKGWAADEYTWPAKPYPLCRPGDDPATCCTPGRPTNPGYDDPEDPAKFCPYYPGDHPERYGSGVPLRVGRPPSKSHLVGFAATPELRAKLAEPDPGRRIRQSMAELVFRNRPMFDYTFRSGLYHQEGLVAVFDKNNASLTENAPYRRPSAPGALTEIDFPVRSIMIKSNWISRERALRIGLRDDPRAPYVRMNILSAVTDNNGTILEPGEHWLVAFHLSSKDTPNWVWASFEHVSNPGRCDFTGCNDSYGYTSPDPVAAGLARNFTSPHVACDDLLLPAWVFDLGKRYAGGTVSTGLAEVLRGLEIGTVDNTSLVPTHRDRAWLSYRLKGTQMEFTDSMGRTTRLGNSVTEGGFMNTSSCIGCHARAGTGPRGSIPPALGVFVNELSEAGYSQSHAGIPVADWYHRSGQPPTLTVLQTDFVWGFLFANSLSRQEAPSRLESLRDRR